MGWSISYDNRFDRDIGYGVPAYCDHPDCSEEIDRGLAYVCCQQEPGGGEYGCGLYFCSKHSDGHGRCQRCSDIAPLMCLDCDEELDEDTNDDRDFILVCRCCDREFDHPGSARDPFDPKPDHPSWLAHKLNDESWAEWRAENPAKAEAMREQLAAHSSSAGENET